MVASLLEALRRKDIYVVLILTVLMTAGAWMFGFFGVRGLEVFIRDVTFSAIGIFSTVLTVMLAARQIPEEVQRRTIYPLLARPISRWQLLFGKWLAASAAGIFGFLLLAIIGWGLLLSFGIKLGPIFAQYLLLKSIGILWLSAMTVALSVYMTVGANITICFILAFGSSVFTRITLLMNADNSLSSFFWSVIYGALPHYDFFDMGGKVTYSWPPIPAWVILSLCGYALIGSFVWLSAGWMRLRRQVI